MLIAINYTLPIIFYTSKLVICACSSIISIVLITTHQFNNLQMNQDLFAVRVLIKVYFSKFNFNFVEFIFMFETFAQFFTFNIFFTHLNLFTSTIYPQDVYSIN